MGNLAKKMVSPWTCESYATYFLCILSKQCSILKIFSLLLLSKIGIFLLFWLRFLNLSWLVKQFLHRHSRAAVESAHFQPQPGTSFLFTCSWDGVVPEIESVCCGYWESGIYWPFLSLCSAWNLGKHWFICRDIIYLDSFVGFHVVSQPWFTSPNYEREIRRFTRILACTFAR